MVHVDLGSRGPWSEPEEFSLDFETAAFILGNYGPTVDGFASRRNKLCHQYFSLALEEEALGRNFFEQELKQEEVYLLHPTPGKLIHALKHSSRHGARTIVVFHLWAKHPHYPLVVKENHLPMVATQVVKISPTFIPAPDVRSKTFSGKASFPTFVFIADFCVNDFNNAYSML